jgi:magnesium transporter
MGEIVEGLGAEARRRVEELTRAGTFFWVDADTASSSREEIEEVLGVDDHALDMLLDFDDEAPPSRRLHVDGKHVVFALSAFLQSRQVDVRVLVCGAYILTVHRDAVSLPEVLDIQHPSGRSEQYMVYAVLDALVATAYDEINEVETKLEELQLSAAAMRDAQVRMNSLREISARLLAMRHKLGPQRGLFERISEEIGRVEGLERDSEQYFERIRDQLGRLVDGIDADTTSMTQLIDLRLNETMYRLTVVATIFLPLTFVVGFFGMNFKWMVDHIDGAIAFLLLGIGLPLAAAAGTWMVIQLRETPVEQDRPGPG